MRLIQVLGVDGQEVALFSTERTDNQRVDQEITEAFDAAKLKEEDPDGEEEIYILDEVEEMLSKQGILRVHTDVVNTEVL